MILEEDAYWKTNVNFSIQAAILIFLFNLNFWKIRQYNGNSFNSFRTSLRYSSSIRGFYLKPILDSRFLKTKNRVILLKNTACSHPEPHRREHEKRAERLIRQLCTIYYNVCHMHENKTCSISVLRFWLHI